MSHVHQRSGSIPDISINSKTNTPGNLNSKRRSSLCVGSPMRALMDLRVLKECPLQTFNINKTSDPTCRKQFQDSTDAEYEENYNHPHSKRTFPILRSYENVVGCIMESVKSNYVSLVDFERAIEAVRLYTIHGQRVSTDKCLMVPKCLDDFDDDELTGVIIKRTNSLASSVSSHTSSSSSLPTSSSIMTRSYHAGINSPSYSSSNSISLPISLNQVSIGDELGHGAMGIVYKAMLKSSGQQIAVKVMMMEPEDKNSQDLTNELNLLSSLDHPRIVRFFGYSVIPSSDVNDVIPNGKSTLMDRLAIFTEYMPGGSIASAIRQFGKFSEGVVIVYCKQILSGLLFLHENRVIHRDLKGDNILLDVNGGCKLADFGCSKKMDVSSGGRTRIMKTMKGSIPWMAPEILMGQGYGKEADVWAFGCLVVEMVTGKPPWGHFDNIIQAMFKITMSSDVPEIPINISFTCREFAFACMRRDSKTRPTCIELISHHFLLSDNLNNHSSPPRMTISHHDTSSSIINKTNSSPSPSTHQSLHPSTSTIITTTLTPTTSPSFSPTYSTTSTAISTPISTPITSTLQLFKLRQ